MQLGIRNNIKEVQRDLSDKARRQIPFATSLAINSVLSDIKRNWEKQLVRKLDRPTPFTKKAFAIRRATKRSLSGMIFAKAIQAEYLIFAEDGGTRQPEGKAVLVPVGQRLNKYGNISRGGVGRALAKPKVFSGGPKGRPGARGVYQRIGKGRTSRLKLLVHYGDRAKYSARLNLKTGAYKTAVARLPTAFLKAMRRAAGTGR
ncbi:hypothetical protein [Falsiruegeria litorea]|uniref:hypothetical protein n=1 Tax=Falsiruegeria litorea TaxID=1280831 RepID=UPI001BFCE116|nr:hypothetical protein [Falsiruegeria litorea]MBT8169885.1 hypothetical protein [Falsiruegeria litorea]